jgi:hypothetical protein
VRSLTAERLGCGAVIADTPSLLSLPGCCRTRPDCRREARLAASMSSPSFSPGGCIVVMGIKERRFDPLPHEISLEDLVPQDNFYRRTLRAYVVKRL